MLIDDARTPLIISGPVKRQAADHLFEELNIVVAHVPFDGVAASHPAVLVYGLVLFYCDEVFAFGCELAVEVCRCYSDCLVLHEASTFFVFSDFMKPAVRLACLQKIPSIYVFTHDSFYVGEDGPTHEPIEQLAMLRTIPGMTVLRPAEANECAAAWAYAARATTPVALILTRQDLAPYSAETAKRIDISKGAYVVDCEDGFEYVLIATGSEVNLALEAAKLLRAEGKKVRVVSMPSRELFLAQSKEYQESVIPTCPCKKRVTIEAASTFGWEKFAGDNGLCIGLDHFGASAPYKVLAEKFGFTPQAVADKIKAFFA